MVKEKWNLSKEKLWKIKQKEKRKINIHEMYLGKYLCGITSHTVPAMRLSVISSFNTIENSKSIILGFISESKRMLLGFRSLWTTHCSCR